MGWTRYRSPQLDALNAMNDQISKYAKGILFISFVCGSLAGIASYFSELTFFAAFFGVWFILWFHNCTVLWEDAMPGGYDNWDGEVPEHRTGTDKLKFWAATLGVSAILCSLAFYCGFHGY